LLYPALKRIILLQRALIRALPRFKTYYLALTPFNPSLYLASNPIILLQLALTPALRRFKTHDLPLTRFNPLFTLLQLSLSCFNVL